VNQADDQIPPPCPVAKLAQVNTLPHAQRRPALNDWNGYRSAGERSLDVRRHVVWPLHIVLQTRQMLGRKPIVKQGKVMKDGRIGILIDRYTGRRVTDKHL